MSRRLGNKKGMLKGLGRAVQRHLSAADERFGLRLGAGLDGTLVAAVTATQQHSAIPTDSISPATTWSAR